MDTKTNDPRKVALKRGLHQLTSLEIGRLINHLENGGDVLLDRDDDGNANYSPRTNTYCPLAIAIGVPSWSGFRASDASVYLALTDVHGFTVYNTRGVHGEFYTKNRRQDLMTVAREVFEEKGGVA